MSFADDAWRTFQDYAGTGNTNRAWSNPVFTIEAHRTSPLEIVRSARQVSKTTRAHGCGISFCRTALTLKANQTARQNAYNNTTSGGSTPGGRIQSSQPQISYPQSFGSLGGLGGMPQQQSQGWGGPFQMQNPWSPQSQWR